MQPYFFPYLGYFELIHRTDRWVVFDIVAYRRKSWMNRNRILHPEEGWQYVTIPVERLGGGTIREARVKNRQATRDRVLGQLEHYRRHAPYFDGVRELVAGAFDACPDDSLVTLNVHTLAAVCGYLGIEFDYTICSQLDLDLPPIEHPGQWAVEICDRLGATDYLNPPGGREIFRLEEFASRGIELHIQNPPPFRYRCGHREFIENLSILDVLMWNNPEQVMERIES